MSDVALVALISGTATVLVALFGLLGNVFGSALLERGRAKRAEKTLRNERELERKAEQLSRAEALSNAIVEAIGSASWAGHAGEDAARIRFIATLGPGEGRIAQYVRQIGNSTKGEKNAFKRKSEALKEMERLFDWLRGDLSIDELVPAVHVRPAEE